MTDQDGRGIPEKQVQRVYPGTNDRFQLAVELAVQPGGGRELNGILPFCGCARGLVIGEKKFIVPANDRPAFSITI